MRESFSGLPNGNCADLLPQVYDKYFLANTSPGQFRAAVARAICANCVVRIECLEQAIYQPPPRGTLAGKNRRELLDIRSRMVEQDGIVHASLLSDADLEIEKPRAVRRNRRGGHVPEAGRTTLRRPGRNLGTTNQ